MKVKQVIKTIIEGEECPLHHSHPIVDTSTNEIKVHTCCSAFHTECTDHVSSILTGIDVSHRLKVA